jgi:hypothetical protein
MRTVAQASVRRQLVQVAAVWFVWRGGPNWHHGTFEGVPQARPYSCGC